MRIDMIKKDYRWNEMVSIRARLHQNRGNSCFEFLLPMKGQLSPHFISLTSFPTLMSHHISYHYPKCKLTAMFYKVIRKNRRLLLIYITMTKIAIIPCQNVCPEPCRWIAELILNAPKVPLPRPTRAFLSVHLRFQAHIRLPICVML